MDDHDRLYGHVNMVATRALSQRLDVPVTAMHMDNCEQSVHLYKVWFDA